MIEISTKAAGLVAVAVTVAIVVSIDPILTKFRYLMMSSDPVRPLVVVPSFIKIPGSKVSGLYASMFDWKLQAVGNSLRVDHQSLALVREDVDRRKMAQGDQQST